MYSVVYGTCVYVTVISVAVVRRRHRSWEKTFWFTVQYYPSGTELAEQFGDGWRYAVMPHRNSDELFHFQESQIQPLTPEELLLQIRAEIEFYQQQIVVLQQQLAVITGGFTNA